MKTFLVLLFAIAMCAWVQAQDPTPFQTLDKLSLNTHEELARSTAELNRLREAIASEKLPLAQDLTALEDKLSKLRRDHDKVTRSIDENNLETAKLRAEIKARQDEIAYVGNILDEYARSFESKVNVCELQAYGKAAEEAKQATENTTLGQRERLAKQTSFVALSMQRLFDAIGGVSFVGNAIDVQGIVADGKFTMLGPIALFRAASGLAGVVIPQSGSNLPLVRQLEGAQQTGLEALTATGTGLVPLDPSRGGALKDLVEKFSIVHIFKKGGPIMWPLLAASLLAMATALERVLFLFNEMRKRSMKAVGQVFGEVERGNIAAAIETGKLSKDYVARTLAYALEHRELSLSNALMYAQAQEVKRFKRGTAILDTVITLAPLLGLLGTVTGMMGSFALIGGELSAPGAITGGIAEALIATAFGLGIAILCLLPYNYLNTKLEQVQHDLETASNRLELLLQSKPAQLNAGQPHGHARPPAHGTHAEFAAAGRA